MATYTYDDMGRITSMTDGADTTTYTRDALGNLTGIDVAGEHALSLRYAYDANGNILSEERTEGGVSVTSVYAYDALGRLVSWQTDDGNAESYTYDAAGNMLTKTVDGQELRMSYDAANRMVSMENGQGQVRYRYDADGNMTVKEYTGPAGGADGILTDTYTYNAQGKLVSYNGYDGSSVEYAYTSTGLLSEKTSTGAEDRSTLEELLAGRDTASAVLPDKPGAASGQSSVTSYLYDLTDTYGQVLTETADGTETLYAYGLERAAALTTVDGITERTGYQYDVRGSVVRTITGSSIASHRYTPYGEQILTDGERKASGYLYNGEAYDAMTGSYYLRARHYEPAMMRFNQQDILRGSITEPLSQNRYLYVQDNPMRYEDPSGENVFLAGLAAAGIGLTTALKQGAKGITAQAVQATQDTQKTTSQVIRTIKASAGLKTIVDALNKSAAGKVVVQLGTAFVNVVTRGQAEAVVKAQKAYDAIKDSNPESVRKWQKAVQEACRVLNGDTDNEKSKTDDSKDLDYYLYGQYGFDEKTIRLLKKLRKEINNGSPDYTQEQKEWIFLNLVGRLQYGDYTDIFYEQWKWDGTSGSLGTNSYMIFQKVYNFTEEEYNYLKYKIRIQNYFADGKRYYVLIDLSRDMRATYKANMEKALGIKLTDNEFRRIWNRQAKIMRNRSDFAHHSITAASILYPGKGMMNAVAQIYTGGSEELKDYAGWLGDATLGKNPSIGNDDYIADLDAENITVIMKNEKVGYEEAVGIYHEALRSGETRASLFLKDNKYNEVKNTILSKLEVENMKQLKKKYPGTYNFLMSLKHNQNELKDYTKK